jgi:hypothetical protein
LEDEMVGRRDLNMRHYNQMFIGKILNERDKGYVRRVYVKRCFVINDGIATELLSQENSVVGS